MNDLDLVTRALYVWVDVYKALYQQPGGLSDYDAVESLAQSITKAGMDLDVTSTMLAVAIHELTKTRG